jgi:hypothetical protein
VSVDRTAEQWVRSSGRYAAGGMIEPLRIDELECGENERIWACYP